MSPRDQQQMERPATRREAPAAAPAADWVARARKLAPVIAAASDRTERERRVPKDVMAAMHEAQLFRMCLPRSLGGGEATPREVFEVLQIVAGADASTGWCLGQGLGCSFSSAYVTAEAARDVFGRPDAVLAWGPPTTGDIKAVEAEGGFRLTGTWQFASGVRNALWIGAHCPVFEPGGAPRLGADGKQAIRTLLFPAGSATLTDIWHVIGLRGTASDRYAVSDLFVPVGYTYARDSADYRREPAPLYRIAQTAFYGIGFAGVALGISRAVLDAFVDLAATKKPRYSETVLRESAAVQTDVARCEAKLGSARAYLVEAIEETWRTVTAGEPSPLAERVRLRIASTNAIVQAREVVDYAYHHAGATAIFEENPFERRFRDMHTVAQQVQGAPSNFEHSGMALLGLDPGARV